MSRLEAMTIEETKRMAETTYRDHSGDLWRTLPDWRQRRIIGNEVALSDQFVEVLLDVLTGTPVVEAVERFTKEFIEDETLTGEEVDFSVGCSDDDEGNEVS